jgi:hypothetical protein
MKFIRFINTGIIDLNDTERRQIHLLILLSSINFITTFLYMIFYIKLGFNGAFFINFIAEFSYLLIPIHFMKKKYYFAKVHVLITFFINILILSGLFFMKESNLHYYLIAIPIYYFLLFGFKSSFLKILYLLVPCFFFTYLELFIYRPFLLPLSSMEIRVFSSTSIFGLSSLIFLMLWFSGNLIMKEQQRLEQTIKKLQSALAEVKTLKGLLPICSKCKNIRDDGYWKRLEEYIEENSDANFSHGLCPDCAEELYGNQPWFDKEKIH